MREKEQNFEGALKKLEKIVENLESGDLSLSDSIKKYEEGMKLSQFCTKKLHDIQKKIEVLVKDSSGNISAKPFSENNAEKLKATDTREQKERSKKTPPAGRRGRRAEELLF
ncbi:MAG: exodeoxyribonuclease VII small subunit [Candidatus Omnitrophota bacterium]|nr:MAG: exodeoxyribonuclease VII small subunit [Candidatus Omnitrophota bacterium]